MGKQGATLRNIEDGFCMYSIMYDCMFQTEEYQYCIIFVFERIRNIFCLTWTHIQNRKHLFLKHLIKTLVES